jgi:thiamine-monophosphate kinase
LSIPPGRELVIAKDAMVEGVHYLSGDPPDTVARKLLRVNLSDLAAMGAEPLGYLTALALPPACDDPWLERFAAGLAADQAAFGLSLLGGDTVRTTGPTVLSLTILGTLPLGTALRRSAARPGDVVCVSGSLGEGALGLRVLTGALQAPPAVAARLIERYRLPQPRLALGHALRGIAHACMDVSDGLVGDLGHIARASQVGAVIETARVPLAVELRGLPGALDLALTGGDDYELLFTLPEPSLAMISPEVGVAVTPIGRVEPGAGVRVIDPDGTERRLRSASWTHF